ncbi:phosphonoacetate hydrolase [Roseinatronobacter sp. NSM]|uniref:phosphonoacetate hydrolase n=1 Tax=Roseinatronobacter sp. NSM TaxID=3457785 RepID=UPI004036FDB2
MLHHDDALGSDHWNDKRIDVNGRQYALPCKPVAVICIDGFDPEYLDAALADGTMPTLAAWVQNGFACTVDAAMPTFTNPNNISIVTGVPPSVHGVSGNYFLDRDTGIETVMVDESFLRTGTILAALAGAGVPVASITAKDKLRKALGAGLKGISFSAQHAGATTLEENGIEAAEALVGRPAPDQYSADLSLFVLDAGIALLKEGRAKFLYLSLSDFIQHAHAPRSAESDDFLRAIDDRLQAIETLGARVALTADHGMKDKADGAGRPNVIYLQDYLNAIFGDDAVRIICPIADPFVRHHGGLGSFVRGYVRDGISVEDVLVAARKAPLVAEVLSAEAAAQRFSLPIDREGDFVALAADIAVIGASADEHDVSTLAGQRLRSHGGISEQRVPLIASHPLVPGSADGILHNWDVFDVALNRMVRS